MDTGATGGGGSGSSGAPPPGGGEATPDGGREWRDDDLLYRSEKTGATVTKEPGWQESEGGREPTISKHLADDGYWVVLRARMAGRKSPDAWLFRSGERREAEFKRIGADATNYPRAVNEAVREAAHQARTIVLFVDRSDASWAEILSGMKGKLRFDELRGVRKVDEVIVVTYDGSVKSFKTQEMLDGTPLW